MFCLLSLQLPRCALCNILRYYGIVSLYVCWRLWAADNKGRSSWYNVYGSFLASGIPAQWSLRTDRMSASVMILDWSVNSEVNNNVNTRSSIESKHCCCSTHSPPMVWLCKVVHTELRCNIPSRTNLHTRYSFCWVPGDAISYPFHDL